MIIIDKIKNKFHEMKHGYPSYYTINELEKITGKKIIPIVVDSTITTATTIDKVENEKGTIFDDIIGQDNIKKILQSMLDSVFNNNTPISILLDGAAGCAKSMFLKDIEKFYNSESYYIDGSKATKAGIFDVLFEDKGNRIKFLIIDEIDKLNINDQEALLTLIEDGRVIQTQKNGKKDKRYENLSVIAASNHRYDILHPLLTRFFKINIKDYSIAEFKSISKKVLDTSFNNLSPEVSDYIIVKVLETKKKPNIRDIKQLAKLCNNSIEMIDLLLENSD